MKRDTKTPFYDVMCNVNESCVLAVYFNKIIGELETVRIFSSPRTFEDTKKENKDYSAIFIKLFFGNCGFMELWKGLMNGTKYLMNTFPNTKGSGNFMLVQKDLKLSRNMEVKKLITMRTVA